MKEPTGTTKSKKRSHRLNFKKMREIYDRTLSESSRVWKAPKGTTKIRIMMLPNEDIWFVHTRETYIPNMEKDSKGAYFTSPRTQDPDAYCPAEEASNRLMKAGRKDEADKLRPRNQYYANAMVNEGGKWIYKIFKFPQTVFNDLMLAESSEIDEELLDENGNLEGGGIIGDPEEGRIIAIHVEEKGGYSKYTTNVTSKVLPIKKEWEALCQSLDEYIVPDKEEDMENALLDYLGIEDFDEIASEEREEEVHTRQRKSSPKDEEEDEEEGQPAPWDDEEEEDTEDELENSTEEELPKSPRRGERPTHSSATGKRNRGRI